MIKIQNQLDICAAIALLHPAAPCYRRDRRGRAGIAADIVGMADMVSAATPAFLRPSRVWISLTHRLVMRHDEGTALVALGRKGGAAP